MLKDKIFLKWFFAGMLIIPELVFSLATSFALLLLGKQFEGLIYRISPDYFGSHVFYAVIALIIQVLGAIGLFVLSTLNRNRFGQVGFIIVLSYLIIVFYVVLSLSRF